VRIHRSVIVNLSKIGEIVAAPSGDLHVILHDSTRLTWSRKYRSRFKSLFEND
jgi:DNA-binding LytR/AlgR family response regulator